MSFKQLIFRNLRKNMKNYYLYVFALVITVALYFSFVTLQFDPAMDGHENTVRGAAAIQAASVLLVAIVLFFLLYANNLFIKRRSKEIGLLQLVGLTKGKIFRIINIENAILYFSSMVVGIFVGFSISKLILMILLKVIDVETTATLYFSTEALIQTIVVFAGIYLLIVLMNGFYIRSQRIISLFQRNSMAEQKVLRLSRWEILTGLVGIGLITFGYNLSTKLFSGDFVGMVQLFLAMVTILASVIIGTYFFYKGSISFIFHLIRKKDQGYVSVNKVLSLSSIMFRMKSNSFLLTIITTLSALAIGLLSLSYIAYYSAEKDAKESVPFDFSIPNEQRALEFMHALDENNIAYSSETIALNFIEADIRDAIAGYDQMNVALDMDTAPTVVLSDRSIDGVDLAANEAVFVNSSSVLEAFLSIKDSGTIELYGDEENSIRLDNLGLEDMIVFPALLSGGFPAIVVHDDIYQQVVVNINEDIQGDFDVHVGIDIDRNSEVEKALKIFREMGINQYFAHQSQLERFTNLKQVLGLNVFIVVFLGLTFLISSGCILYFKQMDQSEDEKDSFTILRKLGFTESDLLKGVKVKQLINFGIPLVLGLSHSYFAVKSSWFFFGTELWTPMIIVMSLYTVLYSIFGILSVMYYKKVVKASL